MNTFQNKRHIKRKKKLIQTGTVLQRSTNSPWTSLPLKIGLISCPETSVPNYHSTLRKISEEHRYRGYTHWSPRHSSSCRVIVISDWWDYFRVLFLYLNSQSTAFCPSLRRKFLRLSSNWCPFVPFSSPSLIFYRFSLNCSCCPYKCPAVTES